MRIQTSKLALVAALGLFSVSCGGKANSGTDARMSDYGTVEVTARLVEVPTGAIFHRELYNYATILKYQIVAVHRGKVPDNAIIYVGHYNPWKPRAEAADSRVKNIGGDSRQFRAGQLQRMALETPMDDFFMGGIVDKYFGRHTGPAYWAVRTNDAD